MLTKEGGLTMKLLKTDSNQGFFLTEDGKYREIDQITKEDLLRLVRIVLNDEESELDKYDDQVIKNQAHQVVFKSVYRNLQSLKERRQQFIDDSERSFLDDYKRYIDEIA